MTGRTRGLYRRENAGMSSETCARNTGVFCPRFPGEGSSTQGKSGPKPRTEVVGDGEQVEIPAPHLDDNEAVTRKDRVSAVMVNRVVQKRPGGSEVHLPKGGFCTGPKGSREASEFRLARKAAKENRCARTVNRRRWARRGS